MKITEEEISHANAVLKYVALVAGTISGIIGLVFDFRNKRTKTITRGGYIILAVIIFSGIISIVSTGIDNYKADKEKVHQDTLTRNQLRKNDSILSGVNVAVKGIVSSLNTDQTILNGVNEASGEIKQTINKNDTILGGLHIATNGITQTLRKNDSIFRGIQLATKGIAQNLHDSDTLMRGMNYAIKNIDRAQYPFTKLRFQAAFTMSLDVPKFKSIIDSFSIFVASHQSSIRHSDLYTPARVNYLDLSLEEILQFSSNDSLLYRIVRTIVYPKIIFNRKGSITSDVQFNLPIGLNSKDKYEGHFDVYPLVYDIDNKTLIFRFNTKIDDDNPLIIRSGKLLSVLDLRYGYLGVVFRVPEFVNLEQQDVRLFRLLKMNDFVLFINNQEWILGKFSKVGASANDLPFHFTFPADLSQLVLESYHPKP